MSQPARGRFEHAEIAALFFLNAAAIGMWNVPLGNVLKAHGYEAIVPFAYACSGVSAFISPMIFGALADQRISPTRLVRGLAVVTAGFLALTFYGIGQHWNARWVLAALQVQSVSAAPIFGLTTAIVMARLRNPAREYGPVRAWGSLGWMAAGGFVSWVLAADTSVVCGYAAAATWLLTAACTLLLPDVPPLERKPHRTWRDVFGLEALELFAHRDHRVVFLTAAFFTIPMAAFYPYVPMQLQDLGVTHAAGAISLGQITELVARFGLAGLSARVRLKWVFLAGIGFGVLRYALCALNDRAWLLVGVTLHGFAFTLYFITAQIYLEQRVPARLRARAQALLGVMLGGFGSLAGYLGNGWWKSANTVGGQTQWPRFWMGLTLVMAGVFVFFALSYRGQPKAGDTA
jgi:MFS family permease